MTTDLDRFIAEVEGLREKAAAENWAAVNRQRRQWGGQPAYRISIPARREVDSDLVIGAGLEAVTRCLALLRAYEKVNAALYEVCCSRVVTNADEREHAAAAEGRLEEAESALTALLREAP